MSEENKNVWRDKEGFDINGFDEEGIHKHTGTKYDLRGYDKDGYNKNGYSRAGYDRVGFNRRGFNREGIHKVTGTEYDIEGYNVQGYNAKGYNSKGFNELGFNEEGIHKRTGTKYDLIGYDKERYKEDGYNRFGYDRDGYNRKGFNREGTKNIKTGTKYDEEGYDYQGYNEEGYDRSGYNKQGFNKEGIHKETGTKYNKEGWNKEGYNERGFNANGTHKKTNRRYDPSGYDEQGRDKEGYDREGYSVDGHTKEGFNKDGIHKETGTKYNKTGFDVEGYGEDGYNKDGYDRDGYDRNGYNRDGYNRDGNNYAIELIEKYITCQTSKEKFCTGQGIKIDELEKCIKIVERINPEMVEKIKERSAQSSAIYLSNIEKITKKLLSGEIDVYRFARENKSTVKVSDILSHTKSLELRKQIQAKVAEAVASGKLTMKDYVRLFSKEYDYKTVMESIQEFLRNAAYENPELQGRGKPINNARIKLHDLKKYERQYQSKDFVGTQRGSLNPVTGAPDMLIRITEEHLELAKRYLHLEDEYICYSTVSQAISGLISGQITEEMLIERENKTRKLEELKEKDELKQSLEEEQRQSHQTMEEAGKLKAEYQKYTKQQGFEEHE